MNDFLDHYCERQSPGLWDEPLNAFSNIFFLIVTLLLIRKITKSDPDTTNVNWDSRVLLCLIIAVCVGSTLWHLFATSWALWADRVPILLFINLYFLSCLVRVLHCTTIATVTLFITYHFINLSTQFYFPPITLNGSLFYIPTGLFLAGTTVVIWRKNSIVAKRYFLPASLLFFVSLVLRTIDIAACGILPVGTHFLWHGLIAVTIYYLMMGLLTQSVTGTSHEK